MKWWRFFLQFYFCIRFFCLVLIYFNEWIRSKKFIPVLMYNFFVTFKTSVVHKNKKSTSVKRLFSVIFHVLCFFIFLQIEVLETIIPLQVESYWFFVELFSLRYVKYFRNCLITVWLALAYFCFTMFPKYYHSDDCGS